MALASSYQVFFGHLQSIESSRSQGHHTMPVSCCGLWVTPPTQMGQKAASASAALEDTSTGDTHTLCLSFYLDPKSQPQLTDPGRDPRRRVSRMSGGGQGYIRAARQIGGPVGLLSSSQAWGVGL